VTHFLRTYSFSGQKKPYEGDFCVVGLEKHQKTADLIKEKEDLG